MKLTMKRISAACLLAMAPVSSWAAIVPALAVGSPTLLGLNDYRWDYTAHASSDSDVLKGTAPTVNPVPTPSSGLQDGSAAFFTIYDFFGYIAGTCGGPQGWVCTAQAIGFTPDDVSPTDTNVVNLTWSLSGANATSLFGDPNNHSPAGNTLGDFSAQSIYGDQKFVDYTSRTSKSTGQAAFGSIEDSVGRTVGPQGQTVPEPGSLALMALGLGSLGMIRRRNRKST